MFFVFFSSGNCLIEATAEISATMGNGPFLVLQVDLGIPVRSGGPTPISSWSLHGKASHKASWRTEPSPAPPEINLLNSSEK